MGDDLTDQISVAYYIRWLDGDGRWTKGPYIGDLEHAKFRLDLVRKDRSAQLIRRTTTVEEEITYV